MKGQNVKGFTLVEAMIAGILLCVALVTGLQFLSYCLVLERQARVRWHDTVNKWNLSREVRSDLIRMPPVENHPVPGRPGLNLVLIDSECGGACWEVLIDER